MTDKVCNCCGQTLPLIKGINVVMPSGLKNIVEIVRRAGKHGISTDRLFNAVYGDAIDGGPLSGHKVLHVRICKANKILRQHNLRISGEHTGGTRYACGRYVLNQIEAPQHAAK